MMMMMIKMSMCEREREREREREITTTKIQHYSKQEKVRDVHGEACPSCGWPYP